MTKLLMSSSLGCLVLNQMPILKMRLLQKCVFGCPMVFFGWLRLCVGLEAFWRREFLVCGGHLIYLVARRGENLQRTL